MIQYPGSKKTYDKPRAKIGTSGRGMSLEEDINQSNDTYLIEDKAVIHKKPTPIQIVSVDYPSRNKARITEAYFRTASTTDYQGIYLGRSLDFEAKETKNKTLFPLNALHEHQLTHLRNVHRHGALAFLIIRFYELNETYLIFAKDFLPYIDNKEVRSLSIKWLRDNAHLVDGNYRIPCDYLNVIDKTIKEEKK